MKAKILQKLHELENEQNIKIIYAAESGSRACGFAAKDADYDVRFIYAHQRDWYLTVQDKKDFIEVEENKVFDIKGIDIKRAIKYIIKPNCSIYEWLLSPVNYILDFDITKQLQDLTEDFFNPLSISYHYFNLAKSGIQSIELSDEAKVKTYFGVLRAIANLNFIARHMKMPTLRYFETLEEITVPQEIRNEVEKLYDIKINSDEHFKISKNELLLAYIKDEILTFAELLKDMSYIKNRNYEQVDVVFRDILEKVQNVR